MRAALLLSVLLALPLTFSSHHAFAAVTDDAYIEGVVSDFDKDTVTLFSEGEIIKVPRTSIPRHISVRAGYPVISYLHARFVVEEIKKQKKSHKKHAARD